LADLGLSDLVLADLVFGFLAQEPPRQAAGHEKLKDHQKLCWNGARL
jgi:hypothetical protein